jgi:hypothetical protein
MKKEKNLEGFFKVIRFHYISNEFGLEKIRYSESMFRRREVR